MKKSWLVLLVLVTACGGGGGGNGPSGNGSNGRNGGPAWRGNGAPTAEGPSVNGSPSPATGSAFDAAVRYNVDRLNAIRQGVGAPPLTLDPQLSAFARTATERFAQDSVPHGHMRDNGKSAPGFSGKRAENQGVSKDRSLAQPNPSAQVLGVHIDRTLGWMMNEGPGGGHHDAIIEPRFRRVGVGLTVSADGRFILTNDFSE